MGKKDVTVLDHSDEASMGGELIPSSYRALSVPAKQLTEFMRENIGDQGLRPIDLDKVKVPAGGGSACEVPTLQGKAAIDIPEGTQAGKQFRLRGKGIKGVRASYPGDLYCHIAVETPVKLTEHQRKLLRELEDSLKKGGARHSPSGESWTDRLKNFFS